MVAVVLFFPKWSVRLRSKAKSNPAAAAASEPGEEGELRICDAA